MNAPLKAVDDVTDLPALMSDLAQRARAAARVLALAPAKQKNDALAAMADALRASSAKLIAANAEDVRVLKPFLAEQSLHYGDLKLPLIVMASDVDNSTSPRLHSQAIVKQVAGAEFIELKGGGHPLHFSRPSEVLAAIDRLAARIAP